LLTSYQNLGYFPFLGRNHQKWPKSGSEARKRPPSGQTATCRKIKVTSWNGGLMTPLGQIRLTKKWWFYGCSVKYGDIGPKMGLGGW